MTRAEEFEQLRSLLFAIAYWILGSVSEAEDADVEGLQELLAADVQLVGDGGGKAPALARSIIGAEKVARCSPQSSRGSSGST